MIIQAIDGDFDGNHPLIVRALVEKPDERIHGIERIGEKHVPFLHALDQADGRHQLRGDAAFKRRIFKYRKLFLGEIFAQRKEKFIVEIVLHLKTERFF